MGGRLVQVYESLGPSDLVQIAVMAIAIYAVLRVLSKTFGVGYLGRGLGLVVLGLFLMVQVIIAGLEMTELAAVLDYLLTSVLLMMLVVFQPELRRALMMLGRSKVWRFFSPTNQSVSDKLADAAVQLSRERVGALMAIQGEISLSPYIDTGERLDAKVSPILVRSIFFPKAPLHDGAIIVVNGRVTAAACQLPLGSFDGKVNAPSGGHLGMRHRAALGLSEETDAVVVAVSEETGRISLAVGGRLEAVRAENLGRRLASVLSSGGAQYLRKAG